MYVCMLLCFDLFWHYCNQVRTYIRIYVYTYIQRAASTLLEISMMLKLEIFLSIVIQILIGGFLGWFRLMVKWEDISVARVMANSCAVTR